MRIVFLLIYVMIFQSASSGEDGKRRLTIGTVGDGLNGSGGCTLQLASQYAKREGLYIFATDLQTHGLINVDGSDTPVELVGSDRPDPARKAQVGEHSTYSYTGGTVEVRVDYTVTEACAVGIDSCRLTRYDAVLTVKRGKASKTVAAKAVCAK